MKTRPGDSDGFPDYDLHLMSPPQSLRLRCPKVRFTRSLSDLTGAESANGQDVAPPSISITAVFSCLIQFVQFKARY